MPKIVQVTGLFAYGWKVCYNNKKPMRGNVNMLKKVKQATLTMQRYSWEQGVVAQAFLEAGEEQTAMLLAVEGANRQTADGRCAQIGGQQAVTDPCAIGEALVFACEKTGDPALIAAKERLLHWALTDAPRNAHGVVYHMDDSREFWVDSFYMLPPFLARAGYFGEALQQMDGYWQVLLDEEKRLLSHRWDDGGKRFIRKDVWGVGNGWALAGMARVRAMLPEGYQAEKAVLEARIRTLLDAATPLQRADGMFHDVLDAPATFPEVNFGQMMAYTIYRGVKEGWLADSYLPFADKARAAAHAQVDTYGLVRNVCGAPRFDSPGVAPEGQAFFILMESAYDALKA